VAFRRTLIVVGKDEDNDEKDSTSVSREDRMVMLDTTIGKEEIEIIIRPSLYPAMMEIMKDWEEDE
jgi:hypothetical protein